ncbi:MAG: bacteriohemerythrin [Rhodospirillales bacterium]|nr:bacteriohemerythrin [Rhodospirillales bacterium]
MGIWKRLLFVTAFLLVAALSVVSYHSYNVARVNALESLQNQAERIRGVIMATRRFYHLQFLESKIPLTDETLGFLPAHALSRISKDFQNWDQSGVHFNNVSDRPRNLDNLADVNEMKAIEFFRNNSSETLYFRPFQGENGEQLYLYANPIWMEPYCIECHGKREDAPPTIRDNYTTAFNYKVGDLRGILSIKLSSSVVETKAMKDFILELMTHLALFLGMFVIIFYAVQKYLKQPLKQISNGMGEIASGHYESRLSGFKGELAAIEYSFNTMAEEISKQRSVITSSKEDVEKANRSKSEFLASMSHELRTPLNAILGFAQMLQFDPQNPLLPAQNERIDCIVEGGNDLLKLVNQILDLARIEADQISLSLEAVNASEVAADCVKLISPLGSPKTITITNTLNDRPLPLLRTDPVRLKQILLNLISNAVKFNDQGGTVIVEGQETDDAFLKISVTDTGHGISKENYFGVFEPFSQINADPMTAHEGTGIGLTVTKQLVERMAGRIGFESEEGVGSTFWIELPIATNMTVLIWMDAMRIGVDAIDNDHQIIIELLNKVSRGHVGDAELDAVIGQLIDYTLFHFSREEIVMETCGYPDLEGHRDQHRNLRDQVSKLTTSWNDKRDEKALIKLQTFLRDWLFNHILKVDTTIASYVHGQERRVEAALKRVE